MRPMETDRITWSVHIACLFEVSADKPGNVTWGKDFWDTRFVDFMASAIAVGPAFRNAGETPVGEIIYQVECIVNVVDFDNYIKIRAFR